MDLEKILRSGKKILTGSLITSTLFFGGCKKDIDVTPDNNSQSQYYENVSIIKDNELSSVDFLDYSTISFYQAKNFKQGDIISGGHGPNTPDGFLLKINSIQNGGKTFSVSPVAFDEAIKKGTFSETKDYNQKFLYSFEEILYDQDGNLGTTDDQTKLKGSVSIRPKITISGEFEEGLKYLELECNTPIEIDLELKNPNEGYNFSKEISISGPILPGFPVNICGLPSYIVPVTGIDLGIEGNIKLSDIRLIGLASIDAKLVYEDGFWSFEKNFNPIDFLLPTKYIPEEINLRAYATPSFALKLNHFIGPYLEANGEIKAEVWNQALAHKISTEVNMTLGIDASIFGKTLFDYNTEIFNWEKILSEAGSNPSADWFEDFDDYSLGIFPTSNWLKGGYANTTGNETVNNPNHSAPHSLQLHGSENFTFPSIASRGNIENDYVSYEFWIRNSSGSFPNGEDYKGSVDLKASPLSQGDKRNLIKFGTDGKIYAQGGIYLQDYTPNNWYLIEVWKRKVEGDSTKLRFTYWINNQFNPSWEYTLEKKPYEDQLDYFSISSGQGNVWFDDITVKKMWKSDKK